MTDLLREEKKMGKKKYKDVVCRKWLEKETKNFVEKNEKIKKSQF